MPPTATVNLESNVGALSVALLLAVAAAQETRGAVTLLSEGFESGLNGWQVGDKNPAGPATYWGVVGAAFGGAGAHGGTNKLYCAATGHTGADSSPFYTGGMGAYASLNLDLSGRANATLSFWHKIPGIESIWDSAKVLIDNTELWSQATAQRDWTQVHLSLDAYAGGIHTLSFEFFSDFAVNSEGWYLDDVLVTDASTSGPPRSNDTFNAAQVLPGANGSVSGSNWEATSEPGEPASGFAAANSVWFRWTTITNGQVTFSTEGSAFDTVLCIYAGTNLAALTLVASDDNSGPNQTSRVTFEAVPGVPYRVSVRGAGHESGFILLSWSQPNVILADLLPDLIAWADPGQNYLHGWYLDRTEIPGRTLLRASTAVPNIGAGPLELIGSSATPGVSQRIYRNDGSSHDRPAGTFTFHRDHGHLHFDNWMSFRLRLMLPDGGVGAILVAGDKTSSVIIDLQEYDPALTGHPAAAQYRGGLVQGLSVGWADVYGAQLKDQWIDVTGVAPGRYWLEESVDPANQILETSKSNNVARILIDLSLAALTGAPSIDGLTNGNDQFTLPRITGQPLGTNLAPGSTMRLAVNAASWFPLGYQWRHAGASLADDGRISGAMSDVLSIGKILPDDAGAYTAVITNAYGSVTSAPANLIVIDNPRAIYLRDLNAAIGGTVAVPVEMLAAGDERILNFSLLFDPALLSHPRLASGADSLNAVITASTNHVPRGSFGVSVAFPIGQAMAGGLGRELARVLFDVDPGGADGATTFVGFGDAPISRFIAATNGATLHPLFAAGLLTLRQASSVAGALLLKDGQFQVSLSGVPGRGYAIERADDLGSTLWKPLVTNQTSLEGLLRFNDPQAVSSLQHFYRARLLPRMIE